LVFRLLNAIIALAAFAPVVFDMIQTQSLLPRCGEPVPGRKEQARWSERVLFQPQTEPSSSTDSRFTL
jgi:hypothetical protein